MTTPPEDRRQPHYRHWRDEFVLSRVERALGRHSELVNDVRHGRLMPVTRGAYRYVDAASTDPERRADDAYLAKIRAIQLLAAGDLVFSGLSAAAIWGLPIIGSWPERVHVATTPSDGGRSNSSIVRSYVGHPAPSFERHGLTVTSLPRTVVDVGRSASFAVAVAMADAALHGQEATSHRSRRPATTREALWFGLRRLETAPGVARCRGVLEFADGRSGSPGESLSRVGMRRLGLPAPELQQEFFDGAGSIGVVDFWWPAAGLVGEFDGLGKYFREEYARGREASEILRVEKVREDRLRATGVSIARWGWDEASNLSLLRAKLVALR